ncbi:hypothetical protein DHEL01_v202664, partial [Diaporthe helianthi]
QHPPDPLEHHSDDVVESFVGSQDSGINLESINVENESETQELGDERKSPILRSGNIRDDAQDDNEATNNYLPPANAEYMGDETPSGNFTKVPDEESDDSDVDDDRDSLAPERDDGIKGHSCIRCNRVRTNDCPRTRHAIQEHLAVPVQMPFASLDDLLSAPNAPGRGLYKIEHVVEEKRQRAAELEEEIRCLQTQLYLVRELGDEAKTVVLRACVAFSDTRGAAGISNKLWAAYEAFCESLECKGASRDGWSVTCFGNHSNSYIQWDPSLNLFKDTAEIPLEDSNFRCEAATINDNGNTEYVVEFWPLARLEPLNGTAKTWEQQYPELYRLAKEAVQNSFGGNTVAQELLLSLPSPNLPFRHGWLLEYAPEPARAEHATMSRRWSYRRACRIPLELWLDSGSPTGCLANEPESDLTTSQDIEGDHEGSESCESHDADIEDDDSGLVEDSDREEDEVQRAAGDDEIYDG